MRGNHSQKRVAVRIRLRHGLGADIAAGAAAIFDHDCLTKQFA